MCDVTFKALFYYTILDIIILIENDYLLNKQEL